MHERPLTLLCLLCEVHYMGMVHCDIKMQNILVEERDGQHRGILTDFDLSKDDKSRRDDVSFLAKSVASVLGPRGTMGALTMAPEVMEGKTPDAASDCWSFGGLILASLYTDEAQRWESAHPTEKWEEGTGKPKLQHVADEQGKLLLLDLLHHSKEERINSMQAVSHQFFAANLQVLKELEALYKQWQGLQNDKAQHTRDQQDLKAQEVVTSKLLEQVKQRELQVRTNEEHKLHEIQIEKAALEKETAELAREQKECEKKLLDLEAKEKELASRENDMALREANLRMPSYYKHVEGFHLVETNHVNDVIQQFLRGSAHADCNGMTGNFEVVSIQRIENEDLYTKYQFKRKSMENFLEGKAFISLFNETNQPQMPNLKDLKARETNEFYL
jgi:serine/threonine protein kinase